MSDDGVLATFLKSLMRTSADRRRTLGAAQTVLEPLVVDLSGGGLLTVGMVNSELAQYAKRMPGKKRPLLDQTTFPVRWSSLAPLGGG